MFAHRRSSRPPIEELIIYALLVITGAIPVTSALAEGGAFGVEATIGAIMGAVGAIGVVVFARQAAHRRVPSTQGTDDGGGSRRR